MRAYASSEAQPFRKKETRRGGPKAQFLTMPE